MKKLVVLPLIAACILAACNKSNVLLEDNHESLDLESIDMSLMSVTPHFDWENQQQIMLTDGQPRILPWYSSANTQIPGFILSDYKSEDGWELLYNLCEYPGQADQNYLIFYNKFTGIIRSFYYLNESIGQGTNGLWGLELTNSSGGSGLLNNIGYFANPSNIQSSNPIAISSNMTLESSTKAITRGWNAFDTEITYDPNSVNSSVSMRFLSYDQNIQNVDLTGDFSSSSEGSIISTNSKNSAQSFANNAAKAAGGHAKDWVKDNVGEKSSGKIIKVAASAVAGIVSGGVTELVGAGINLLFGSFIGKKSEQTTTNQKLEFKTNGKLNITGTIDSSPANNVAAAANLWFPGTLRSSIHTHVPYYNKQLGVWNLSQTPVVEVRRKAFEGGWHPSLGHDISLYSRRVSIQSSSIDVVLNPVILSEIEDYSVETDLVFYEKFQGSEDWNGPVSSVFVNGLDLRETLFDDSETRIERGQQDYVLGTRSSGEMPPIGEPIEMPNVIVDVVDPRYVVKVTVTLYPKEGYNTDPIVITRSYLPTYILT